MFQQFLANSLTAPASRRNYTSGAKKWIEARGGNSTALTAYEAYSVAKGCISLKPHVTTPTPALTPLDLVRVCQYLGCVVQAVPVKAALCVGFFAFLRASNLLTPATTLWSGPHTLMRGDITTNPQGLTLVIRSSKTITRGTTPAVSPQDTWVTSMPSCSLGGVHSPCPR